MNIIRVISFFRSTIFLINEKINYEDFQTGFIILASKFNGLSELSKRGNILPVLIDVYKNAGEKGFIVNPYNIEDSYWTLRFNWIEILGSQRKFLNEASNSDRRELMLVCFEKYSMKTNSIDFSIFSTIPTLFLMARILEAENDPGFIIEKNKNEALKEFVSTSKVFDEAIGRTILELSANYLKK